MLLLVSGLLLNGASYSFGTVTISPSGKVTDCTGNISLSGTITCGNCIETPSPVVTLVDSQIPNNPQYPFVSAHCNANEDWSGNWGRMGFGMNKGVIVFTASDDCNGTPATLTVTSNGGNGAPNIIQTLGSTVCDQYNNDNQLYWFGCIGNAEIICANGLWIKETVQWSPSPNGNGCGFNNLPTVNPFSIQITSNDQMFTDQYEQSFTNQSSLANLGNCTSTLDQSYGLGPAFDNTGEYTFATIITYQNSTAGSGHGSFITSVNGQGGSYSTAPSCTY